MKVRQIMSRKQSQDIASVTPDNRIADAAAILSEKRIGCVLVTNAGGGIAGILSERDIVRRLGTEGGACLDLAVSELMTANVMTCGPEDDSGDILKRMTEGRFRHMPVVENGAVQGLISIGDVVSARITFLERDNEALEEMIRSATA